MPLDTIQWLDNLCHKLQHVLQEKYKKEYWYNFDFANQATQNSVRMMESQRIKHFEQPLPPPATAEVIAAVGVENNDESTLVKIVDIWDRSDKHRNLLVANNSLGIGFAYDLARNLLYATGRLGK